MKTYSTYLRHITIVCLAGAMFLAPAGNATSLTARDARRTSETAPKIQDARPISGMAGVSTPAMPEIGRGS
jgi:hypothetical protein